MENIYHDNDKKNQEKNNQPDLVNKILDVASNYAVPEGLSNDEAFEKLMKKINAPKVEKKTFRLQTNHFYWAAAASLVLFVSIFMLFQKEEYKIVLAENGKQTQYILPDGSTVTLNAGSQISFLEGSFSQNRTLQLSGEAFFEVKKGTKFQIETTLGHVEILGTSLNVISRKEQFKVSCLTGKVKVSMGTNQEIITPGQSVEKNQNSLKKFDEKNIQTLASWRTGDLYFENTPIIHIFEEMERQFNLRFIAPDLGNRLFTGKFSNKDLIEALDILCIPMNLKYEVKDNKTVIISAKDE